MSVQPYPLVFEPILLSKVWGGDSLSRFGKAVAPGSTIGESWEIADLAQTSSGGAGGGAQRSVIANGGLKGRTLHEAVERWGAGLLGRARPAPGGGFPLLVKFLDAKENLSVQVHPSPAYATANAGCHLKTESWYILDAAPGGVIYKGVRPGATRESFERAIRDNRVVDEMIALPAVPGECHTLPSGTCHALGAGVLVAEVQTPSDTTFRVYDWGRTGRDLHIEQSLACIDFGPAKPGMKLKSPTGGVGPREKTDFYALRHAGLSNGAEAPVSQEGAACVVMVLAGAGSLYSESGDMAPVDLKAGMTVLVPASLSTDAVVAAAEVGRVECLLAELPA